MRARLWLRIASVFVFLFFVGHTAAVLIPQPSSGPAEDAAVGAMKAFHFDAMGSDRTLWNFWDGFNYTLSVLLLTLAVAAWQLGGASRRNPLGVRPLVATLGLGLLATAVLCGIYFFVLPAAFSTIAAVAFLLAWRSLRAPAAA
ncbi:MAG: hypothetical protein ABW056_00535 [Thermoanaerobaculia bacterium]